MPRKAPEPLPVPKGTDRLCVYCYGTGTYQRVRACSCQSPGDVCDNLRLARQMGSRVYRPNEACDGWVVIVETCDHGAAAS